MKLYGLALIILGCSLFASAAPGRSGYNELPDLPGDVDKSIIPVMTREENGGVTQLI